jgi:hypothetical protein
MNDFSFTAQQSHILMEDECVWNQPMEGQIESYITSTTQEWAVKSQQTIDQQPRLKSEISGQMSYRHMDMSHTSHHKALIGDYGLVIRRKSRNQEYRLNCHSEPCWMVSHHGDAISASVNRPIRVSHDHVSFRRNCQLNSVACVLIPKHGGNS